MLLSIIIIVLLVLIAGFHFTQGLFASTVSAVCAGIAALMAFSYHESVAARFGAADLGSFASPVSLVVIFAVVFIALRFFADNLLAGNVRFPVALDRVGAPVMGLIAAFFSTAIIAIAAQELPFGPSVMWYKPYTTEDQTYVVDRRFSGLYRIPLGDDAVNDDQLLIDRFGTDEALEAKVALWVPVDDWFITLVGKLSDQGSLAGPPEANFKYIYPDFKTAIFGQRLGMQRSAKQIAYNLGNKTQIAVEGLYRVNIEPDSAQFAGGIPQVQGDVGAGREGTQKLLQPRPGNVLLILRAGFTAAAADQGDYVRFGPGAARLVIAGQQYFPIATLESGAVAVQHRPDDYLLAKTGTDLIYEIDAASAMVNAKLVAPAFFEFKEFARVDLGEEPVISGPIRGIGKTHVLRKLQVQEFIAARVAGASLDAGDADDAFTALRAALPDEDPGPEATTQPTTRPATRPADGEEGQTPDDAPRNPMDVIRDESRRRNDEIGGGGG